MTGGLVNEGGIKLEKHSQILVNVDEVLPDILVVSYAYETKLFQGVLLDSNKRSLPCGVTRLNPALTPQAADDKLFAVSQRFDYQNNPNRAKTPKKLSAKKKDTTNGGKMTIRLRPRQVLCSKCKGICNENSENVEGGVKKRDVNTRLQAKMNELKPTAKRGQFLAYPTLIPKLTRLETTDLTRLNIAADSLKKVAETARDPLKSRASSKRKKSNPLALGTKTLKISFGRGGEGTVVKIPNFCEQTPNNVIIVDELDKEKRALRKARKRARKSESSDLPFARKHKRRSKRKKMADGKDADDPLFIPDPIQAIKERCLKQKLSINLQRLNDELCSQLDVNNERLSNDDDDDIPNFPTENAPNHADESDSRSCHDSEGNRVVVGTIVWGKVPGCPWWPGKVLKIIPLQVIDADANTADVVSGKYQAKVSWYGSPTSSFIPCDQLSPFLQSFKNRYNKKRRGVYKQAIRLARTDASGSTDASLSANLVPILIPPPLSSPPEINCMS